MSRFYKAKDIEREIERLLQFKSRNDFDFGTKHGIETVDRVLKDLIPIETSEDCISREWVRKNMLKYGFLAPDMTVTEFVADAPSAVPITEQSSEAGEWKWESEDTCDHCGYEIPHLERIVGETVLMDSRDWKYCPNCGKKKGAK